MDYKVIFYEKECGETPAEDFLNSCDIGMRSKMSGSIAVLQEKGSLTREPYSKHLEDGIFELRAVKGSNISRVLYFFYYGGKIILTNGFIKKTQKTPRKEIELAKKYRADFIERYGEHNENI